MIQPSQDRAPATPPAPATPVLPTPECPEAFSITHTFASLPGASATLSVSLEHTEVKFVCSDHGSVSKPQILKVRDRSLTMLVGFCK